MKLSRSFLTCLFTILFSMNITQAGDDGQLHYLSNMDALHLHVCTQTPFFSKRTITYAMVYAILGTAVTVIPEISNGNIPTIPCLVYRGLSFGLIGIGTSRFHKHISRRVTSIDINMQGLASIKYANE